MNVTSQAPNTDMYKNRSQKIFGIIIEICLVILILTGIFFRFSWGNWSQGTNLHPDEYGLTNTLTQLAIPKNLADYFNTRISPLSPYQKYDINGKVSEPGPDNRMRWGQFPLTIIRFAGELSGNTGYGEIRLLGRTLSALADTLTLLFIFLIGRKLYGRRVGLLAAALSALSVMQIQQAHFMTVDNFGGFFTTLGLFACVQIAGRAPVTRTTVGAQGLRTDYRITAHGFAWAWYILFGAAFGMALACKVNLLPVGGMVLVAAFISIADLKLKTQADLKQILSVVIIFLTLAFFSAALVFRVTQPMTFRASSGDTSLFSLHLNQDWLDSMKVASAESSGEGGGPPGEQWAHRLAIVFPLTNMVLWGMGVPLGLAGWLGFGAALWQSLRHGKNWQAHLLPLVWTGGYFLFMGTRWVKSVRYFLPIYPFLCLLAAWGLLELWRWAERASVLAEGGQKPPVFGLPSPLFYSKIRILLASSLIGLTVLGTLAWANAFVQAVYQTPHTRIQATRWIFQNIPGPIQLELEMADGTIIHEPLEAPDYLQVSLARPYTRSFTLQFAIPQNPVSSPKQIVSGQLRQITLPRVQAIWPSVLQVVIANDPDGKDPLGEASLAITTKENEVTALFQKIQIQAGKTYFLILSSTSAGPISISKVMIANESWDEGLPVPFDGRDPFGQYYHGTAMEVRWPDDEHKRQVLLDTLAESNYLILPSQRSIWSTCRIPNTYPMTMEYYRALFDGRLGFEQVASFSAPLKLGPVWVSDVGGTFAWVSPVTARVWNKTPALPLFNHNWLAAEEAFSVYDHPPVWIFKKGAGFSLEKAKNILNSVDLSKVIVQSALNANGDWCPAQ